MQIETGEDFLKIERKNQNKDDCQFHIKNNNYQHQEEQKNHCFVPFLQQKITCYYIITIIRSLKTRPDDQE